MAYVVGQKGQVVISKEIRQRLGVQPGWTALQSLVNDHIEVYFLPPEHRKSLKGSLAAHTKVRIGVGKEWDEAREAAWRIAGKEKVGIKRRGS